MRREEHEKDGENKNIKWENSGDRYEYMALNIWKNSNESQEEAVQYK